MRGTVAKRLRADAREMSGGDKVLYRKLYKADKKEYKSNTQNPVLKVSKRQSRIESCR